jgi:Icc-related predicted phosphoesterase
MKILAFTDTHLNKKAIIKIIENSDKVDLLICAGDISWFGVGLDKILRLLNSKLKKLLFIIPGNHEDEESLKNICERLKKINYAQKKSIRYGKYLFFFWGGGGFSVSNPKLEAAIPKFKERIKPDDKVIFVTHGPPYNTDLDHLEMIGHVGCKSQKLFLKEIKPLLHISGHLHENFNKHEVLFGKTLIINPGPAGTILEV